MALRQLTKRIVITGGLTAAGAALATAVSAAPVAAASGVPASTTAAAADMDCWGHAHHNDSYLGIAGCTNNTNRVITFRANVVCGSWWDTSGNEVTLRPGQYGESTGRCSIFSDGVTSVGAEWPL